MPKKFGTNTKSAEARARREEVKQAEKEKKQREAEDALWRDDDKHVLRKLNRKEEKDKKKQEMLDKKAALKAAYEEEMNSLKTHSKTPTQTKVTRAEIISRLENSKAANTSEKELMHDEKPLEENINRLRIEGEEARSVEEAISVLSAKSTNVDRHPERRMKAAYQTFENVNLPRLKAENPNLRLSQLKQMLKKEWMKSPENPINQQTAAYNNKQ
uniref:Coiled-coil domain-containing protein 124 n=1 Tax=Hadrurus spadix TaxID=141984 RepID=A0A1W7RAT8_9SCOR